MTSQLSKHSSSLGYLGIYTSSTEFLIYVWYFSRSLKFAQCLRVYNLNLNRIFEELRILNREILRSLKFVQMTNNTMALSSVNEPELLPCSFKFHNFLTEVGEVKMSCQIIKMQDSFYIWISDFSNNVMNDLSLALISAYEKVPISTKLLGSVADSTSTNMAKRLAKKLGIPVYISFNIQADNLSMPAIEKKLQQEITTSLALLTE